MRLSPKVQLGLAVAAVAAGLWTASTSLAFLTGDARVAAKERQLEYVSGELDAMLSELDRLQNSALKQAQELEERQRFLEMLVQDVPQPVSGPDGSGAAAAEDYQQQSYRAPKAASLLAALIGARSANADSLPPSSAIGARTAALVERLAQLRAEQEEAALRLVDRERWRVAQARTLLAKLALRPEALLAQADKAGQGGMGGPLLQLDDDAEMPSAFRILQEHVTQRLVLDRALASVPSRVPSDNYYISSHFGPRVDPISRRRAHHPGVDMAGWPGEPILAAGAGLVVKAGRAPAYGHMVEIDHGNGFRTRYGHMRKLAVKAGERVDRGQKIGEMGTTGRSTGTHLHWEVRFAGKLLDPLPFLEASDDVYSFQNKLRSQDS